MVATTAPTSPTTPSFRTTSRIPATRRRTPTRPPADANPPDDGAATPATDVRIVSVQAWDPDGTNGAENDAQAPLALADGSASTAWPTECYQDRYLGGKRGVGLILDLSTASPGTLSLETLNAPYQIDVYTADSVGSPADLEAWDKVGSTHSGDQPGIVTATDRGRRDTSAGLVQRTRHRRRVHVRQPLSRSARRNLLSAVTTFDRTDSELVAAAQGGDPTAMDQLLRRHYDRVHAVCRGIAGSTRDADDAAQEAMIRVVRNLDRFDGRAAFGTWVYRIATNTALDELRKRKRRPQLRVVDDEDDVGAVGEPVDRLAERQIDSVADRITIDAALAGLPEEFKVAVVMRDVGDLDYAEIAAALDLPIGTVKSRIARGRRLLIEQLGNREHPGERPTSNPPTTP